ncbi:hypothetical protein FI667_g14956, partial [Globisporangium splendens]
MKVHPHLLNDGVLAHCNCFFPNMHAPRCIGGELAANQDIRSFSNQLPVVAGAEGIEDTSPGGVPLEALRLSQCGEVLRGALGHRRFSVWRPERNANAVLLMICNRNECGRKPQKQKSTRAGQLPKCTGTYLLKRPQIWPKACIFGEFERGGNDPRGMGMLDALQVYTLCNEYNTS